MPEVVIEIFYLSGVIIGAFLSFVLLTKPDKTVADYLLAGWLAVSACMLLSVYLLATGQYILYPTITLLGVGMLLVQGPLLYLYVKYQTTPLLFQKKDLLHFLHFVFGYLLFIPFYLLPFEAKVSSIRHNAAGFETENRIRIILVYISGLIYISLSCYKLLAFRKTLQHRFSNIEKINFRWLLYLILGMALIWVIVLLIHSDQLVFIAATLFVWWTGYFGVNQVNVFSKEHITDFDTTNLLPPSNPGILSADTPSPKPVQTKYARSSLEPAAMQQLHQKLMAVLEEKKPYLHPELTLPELAGMVGCTPNLLSEIINTVEQKSFYELINNLRIVTFLEQITLPDNKKYTLLTIAYNCGFNSKASFNRNFKKITGKTPREYLDAIR